MSRLAHEIHEPRPKGLLYGRIHLDRWFEWCPLEDKGWLLSSLLLVQIASNCNMAVLEVGLSGRFLGFRASPVILSPFFLATLIVCNAADIYMTDAR